MKLKEVENLQGTVFENGYKVLNEKGLVIIWMSVGNSYFDKEKIEEILGYAINSFSEVKILIPYEPAIYTYLALGYDKVKASSKARLGSNRLKNHTKRVVSENKNIEIVNWAEVEKNKLYQESLKFITELYNTNKEFQKDANETTQKILANKNGDNVSGDNIEVGVEYLLEELAFVLASPDFFQVERTVYQYHRPWPIYEKLVNGLYDHQPKQNIGFLLVNEKGKLDNT